MPLLWIRPFAEEGRLGLWEITEQLEDLQRLFRGSESDITEYQTIHHPQKQREFLASRILTQTVVESVGEPYHGIRKDDFDKPFLHHTESHFSLSHTLRYATVVWHPSARVGLDIEPVSEKLSIVAHKFLNETELEHSERNLHKLAIYWTAKEALYKLYGEKKLSFKGNIPVEPFAEDTETIRGWIRTPEIARPYEGTVIRMEDCIMTVVAESDSVSGV